MTSILPTCCARWACALIALLTTAFGCAAQAQPPAPDPLVGAVLVWKLSDVTRSTGIAVEPYPDEAKQEAMQWVEIKADPSGLVDIARHRKPLASTTSQVWAKARLRATVPEDRPIAFGYSDNIAIFLNGRPIFKGSGADDHSDRPLAEKISWKDTLYLPLERGDNELMLLISAQSGGWGFMFRDLSEVHMDKALARLWDLQNRVEAPESIAYDAKTNCLYVSSFGGGSIAKVGVDGQVLAAKWATGLDRPTGVRAHNNRIFVVERPGVAEIDIATGQVVKRHSVAGARFINDLSLSEQGAIFVTDSAQAAIYKLADGNAELWLANEALGGINAILAETGRLLVGVSKDSAIKAINLETKEVTTLVAIATGAIMDGLVSDGRGGYVISDYRGRIYRVSADGQAVLLLDRTGPNQFSADIEYVPEKGLLLIPSLFDNRLTAYSYRP